MPDPTEYDREQDARDDRQDARDEAGDRRDAAQDRRLDDLEGHLDELQQIELSPGEAAENPGAQEASPAQRLRIHVPNVKTTVSLGAKAPAGSIRDADAGAPNFHGFGVDTEGHVFIDARKSPADSMIRIQAKGSITLQTPSSFAAGGQHGALMASNGGAVVAGGGGAVIFGGAGLPWSDNQVADASTPDSPQWISNVETSANNWATAWAGWDALVASASVIASRSDLKITKNTFASLSNLTAAVATYGGMVGGAISAYGFAKGVSGSEALPSLGGTTIHGSTGLILGSGATAGLYSTLGTCIASVLSVGVVAPATSIAGLVSAELKGGKTEVKGWTDLSLIGGHTTEIAARGGPGHLQMKASKIYVGKLAQEGSQCPTEMVHVVAKRGIVLETKASGDPKLPVHTPGVTLETHGHLDVKAAEKVTIESTTKEIELLLDQHNSAKMTMGKTHLLVNDTQLILEKGKGATIQQTTDGGAYIKKDRVSLAFGGNHLVVKKSGQHVFKGSKINIKASTINLG
ncbi:MAG: hypothetical protein VYE22_10470 [Myxococcota bacterium]|nr:hypothetical protein [Myxococcota bacterium]